MNLGLAIFLIIIALLIGLVGGFYGARAYMKKYFQDNPPISYEYDEASTTKIVAYFTNIW